MNPVAASDLLLALASVAAAARLLRGTPLPGRATMLAGSALLAVAALAGALRYAVWPDLAAAHRMLSDIAGGFGLPAVAVGLLIGLRPLRRVDDTQLLAGLCALFVTGAALDAPRVAGGALSLLAAVAVVLCTQGAARIWAALAMAALLTSAAIAPYAPQTWAVIGLHVALAVALLAWATVWRATAVGRGTAEIRWARAA